MSNADEFFKDPLRFDAVMMNFIVIGECAGRLTQEFKDDHSTVNWAQIKAFRNLVAHDYFGVDAEEVWQIIAVHLKKLKMEIQCFLDN